jgi:biotin carboxyl carrier protein
MARAARGPALVTFELEVGGRMRHVETRGPEVFLDDQRVHVDAARFAHTWSLLIEPAAAFAPSELRRVKEAGPHDPDAGAGFSRPVRSYEVAVVEHPAGGLTVHVNGRAVAVRSTPPGHGGPQGSARPTRGRHGIGVRTEGAKHGPQRVVAPMPGRIAKVLVKAGDVVAARQGLVVVEAMKMENELRSPRAGTVTEVRAVEGALVEANAVLVIVG